MIFATLTQKYYWKIKIERIIIHLQQVFAKFLPSVILILNTSEQ